MKSLVPFALLALAALCPAPINDARAGSKPTPERSEGQVLGEMRFNGAYDTVGRVPQRSVERVVPRAADDQKNDGAVASASAEISRRDDGAIVRASEQVAAAKGGSGVPVWLMLVLAVGGAFAVVRGLRAWADKALPVPQR